MWGGRAKVSLISRLQPSFHFSNHTRSFPESRAEALSPGDLLLQLGHGRHIEHDSEGDGGLQGVLIQLLLQRLFQIHPPALILFVVVPEAEVRDLERGKVTEGGRNVQKGLSTSIALIHDLGPSDSHLLLFHFSERDNSKT